MEDRWPQLPRFLQEAANATQSISEAETRDEIMKKAAAAACRQVGDGEVDWDEVRYCLHVDFLVVIALFVLSVTFVVAFILFAIIGRMASYCCMHIDYACPWLLKCCAIAIDPECLPEGRSKISLKRFA